MKLRFAVILGIGIILSAIVLLLSGNLNGSNGYKVGVSNGFVGNNWRNQMIEDIYTASDIYINQGYIEEIIVKNAGTDVNNQIEQIRHFIASDIDLLLINPNSDTELTEVIDDAISKGIVVIVFDQNVFGSKAVQLTIDQKTWGRQLGEWMKDELNEFGNIVIVQGVKDQPCNKQRMEGILEVINAHPKIRIIDHVYGNWDQATAKQVMTDMIATYNNIDGVITQDGMALGVLQAYESTEAPLPVITGETMVAYIEKFNELNRHQNYESYAVTNPPGIGASALSLGLLLLENKVTLSEGEWVIYPTMEMNISALDEAIVAEITNRPGTYYMDEWLMMEEMERFLGDRDAID